jgi:hypothetical protein
MNFARAIATAVFLVSSTLASATVTYTFMADGFTESYAQQGSAVFVFSDDGSSLSITLTDTVSPTESIQSEISGLMFAFSSAPTSIALTSVSTTAIIDCTNSANPCPAGEGTSPFGWGTTSSGGSIMLGAGYDGSTFAYQPYGIVNENYISVLGDGGLATPSNNPLLIGPVTFNFALTGLRFAPEVNSVVFAFGDPILTAAVTVPEPGTIALLGVALLALALQGQRKRRRTTAR